MDARPPLQKRRLRPRIEDFRPGRSAACLRHSAVDNEGRAWGGGRRGEGRASHQPLEVLYKKPSPRQFRHFMRPPPLHVRAPDPR